MEKVSGLTRRAIQGSAAVKPALVQDHGFDRVRRLCRQHADRARQELTLGFFLKVCSLWLGPPSSTSCGYLPHHAVSVPCQETLVCALQVLLLILLRRLRPRAAKRLELLCLSIPLPAALAKLQVLAPLPVHQAYLR